MCIKILALGKQICIIFIGIFCLNKQRKMNIFVAIYLLRESNLFLELNTFLLDRGS